MNKAAQMMLTLSGLGWAMSMLILGLASMMLTSPWGHHLAVGLALVGASLFVVMWLVLDRLVPDAGRVFTGTLKLVALVLFYACGTAAVIHHWPAATG